MKLSPQQLGAHLKSHLLPVYLITGNEPLLLQEATDELRRKAQGIGFLEVKRYEVTKDFNWNNFFETSDSLSLFSNKCCIELKLNYKPTAAAAKSLASFIEHLTDDTLLIISSDKLDSATKKASWLQAINQVGAIITVWPLDYLQFMQWLKQRLSQHHFILEQRTLTFLADQTEGNLLAAAQEIEKLKLLFQSGSLPHEEVIAAVTENARYDLFNFIDSVLAGEPKRMIRMLRKIRDLGVEPPLLLWALTREIRTLTHIFRDFQHTGNWAVVAKKNNLWDKRQSLVKNSLQQHSLNSFHKMLLRGEKIDKIIKGVERGNVWLEIELLALELTGRKFPVTTCP